MFNHYTYIVPEHHVALASCIRNHSGITSPVLAKLYKAALDNVDKPVQAAEQFTSHLKSGNISVGTSTDAKTGIFVQLARADDNPRLLLTVGYKWAMDQSNPLQGNIATKLW